MSLIILPTFLIDKILLYNIHPAAELLIKKFVHINDRFDLLVTDLCITKSSHYYNKFNEIQKKYLSKSLQNSLYKNKWDFCCNDKGISIK